MWWPLRAFFLVIWLLVAALPAPAQAPSREYQLKAVFLFHFTQFVNWPANSFEMEQSPVVIGVLGKNPFGTYLDETVLGEKVNGRPVIVQYYANEKEIGPCHILFVNEDGKDLSKLLETLRGKNILTVSDRKGFSRQGGMIRFLTRSNKIKIQVNMEACKTSQLVLSSKLLRLAEIINPQKKMG